MWKRSSAAEAVSAKVLPTTMAVGAADTSRTPVELGVGLEVEAGALVGQGLAGLAEDLGDVQVGDGRDLVLRRDAEAVEGHPAEGRSALPQRGEDLGDRARSGMGELGVPFAARRCWRRRARRWGARARGAAPARRARTRWRSRAHREPAGSTSRGRFLRGPGSRRPGRAAIPAQVGSSRTRRGGSPARARRGRAAWRRARPGAGAPTGARCPWRRPFPERRCRRRDRGRRWRCRAAPTAPRGRAPPLGPRARGRPGRRRSSVAATSAARPAWA